MIRRDKNSSCPALYQASTPFFPPMHERRGLAGTSPAMTGRAQAAIIRLRRRDFVALLGGAASVLAARSTHFAPASVQPPVAC